MAKGRKTGGGSRKGVPNKATADVRRAIALLAERNVHKLEGWLDRVARKDPAKAATILLAAMEYHIPKLARQDIHADVTHSGKARVIIVPAKQSLGTGVAPAEAKNRQRE